MIHPIIINSYGRIMISRYYRTHLLLNKMTLKNLVMDNPTAQREQMREITKWNEQAFEALERVVDRMK